MSTTGEPGSAGRAIGGRIFAHLAESREFAEFALILKRLTGLSMALNAPDVAALCVGVPGDGGNPLCTIIRATAEGAQRCKACDRRHHVQAGRKGKARLYTCHAGFFDMAIPILLQGEHVATISSGQVLPERPSEAGFARLCRRLEWLGVPESRLHRAYARAPWMPRARLAHVMRLLEIFAGQLCDSAWRILQLETRLERPEVRAARALVEERFGDAQLRMADAAAHAGLSTAHFSHVFHRETGMPFTRYVQARRVEEARRLLARGGQSITEICFACGFSSLTHFNRVFKRAAGCSPSQYRAQCGA